MGATSLMLGCDLFCADQWRSFNVVTEASRTQHGNILHEVIVLMLINQEGELLKISGA